MPEPESMGDINRIKFFPGWYVPRYVQDYASEVLFGTFSEQAADYFNHTFYLGSSAWTTEDQAIIDYNHWDLTIKNLTGEYEFLELLLDRYSKNEPILFYFWKPHPIHQILDLVKIQLEDAGNITI
jgi:glycine betaine/proline transport system substrate-binding protein